MADEAHILTDKELAELEKRIAGVYDEAAKQLDKTINDYFEQFAERDAKMLQMVKDGKVSEEHYKQWRLNQIGRGNRYKAMRDKVAERYTKANEVAIAYINDKTPSVYALNRNYEAYTIYKLTGADFTAWDEQTVKRLIKDKPELMPYYPPKKALKRGIDLAYGKERIGANVTSGILRGLSPYKIADELQTNIKNMNRSSAVRTARTAVTSAQNAGRMQTFHEAEQMGIKLEKQWMAVLDGRTRHEHRLLDGQTKPVDEPFTVDGEEIMFPGDPSAAPYLTYNCRCTLVTKLAGVDYSGMKRRARNENGQNEVIEYKTYRQWYKEKTGEEITKKGFTSSKEPLIIKLPDIQLPKSIGAMAKIERVMDLATGEEYPIAENTRIKNVEVFAGYGVKKKYEQAWKFKGRYGGELEKWQHAKGIALLETEDGEFEAEIHWSQCEGIGRVEPFIKRWLDE